MHTKTKFVANDGSEWDSAEQALMREEMIDAVEAALSFLKPVPSDDGCRFANGHGYVQQSGDAVRATQAALYSIANHEGVLKWWLDSQKNDHGKTDSDLIEAHPSWFCRMLEGGHRPLNAAYHRLTCIDSEFREWGQPYFVAHPEKAEQFAIDISNEQGK